MSFADYDWSSVKILDVFSVTGHKAGTKLYSEGRTDIYQFGAKLTGKTEIIYNGKVIEYFAGSVLYLPKEKAHGVQYDKTFLENGKSICIFFDSEKPLPSEPVIIQNGCRFAGTAFTELCNIFGGNSKIGFKSASLFYEILDCLENATKKSDELSDAFIERAYEYIDSHICEEYIDFSSLASLFNLSADRFRHKFKSLCGISPKSYCNRVKTSRIKELLCNNDISIAEVARMTGFSDVNYFSRFFKKQTGFSPSEYRKIISRSI